MNLNHFYHYYKSKSGGEANLLKATEDFDSSRDWNKLPSTDAPTVSSGITDPNGGSDAQRINFTDNRQARVQQRVSLSASTQYTFSVYARVNTGTEQFRLRNVTLGEAEAKTATTSWTRFEYTFTTTTGGNYDLSIQNSSNDARTVEFWGAMLNVGASANAYVKVDPSISGSTPTPAYSGFGDTYGDVTAYYSLRKFTEAETLNAIRVRRSSDDTEQDIGFDANGDLDTTALLAFVGNKNLFAHSDPETGDTRVMSGTITSAANDWGLGFNNKLIFAATIPSTEVVYDADLEASTEYTLAVRVKFPNGETIDATKFGSGSGKYFYFIAGAGAISSGYSVTELDTNTYLVQVTTTTGSASNSVGVVRTTANDGAAMEMTGFQINEGDTLLSYTATDGGVSGDGAVTTFYDQSGNGNSATNSTASEQPLVVSGGTLVTDTDGDASIYNFVNGALVTGLIPSYDQINSQAYSLFVVAEIDSASTQGMLLGDNSSGSNFIYASEDGSSSTAITTNYSNVSSFIDGSAFSPTTRDDIHTGMHTDAPILVSAFYDTGGSQFGGANDYPRILGYSSGTTFMAKNKIKEWILFESDQSSNRTGMETNINDHFDIYT